MAELEGSPEAEGNLVVEGILVAGGIPEACIEPLADGIPAGGWLELVGKPAG